MRQRIFHLASLYYDDLVIEIENWINTLEDTHEIQQIDYFNMDVNDDNHCSAIVLFKPKKQSLLRGE